MTPRRTGIAAPCLFSLFFVSAASASFERTPAGPECAALAEIASVGDDAVFGIPARTCISTHAAPSLRIDAWSAHPFRIQELRESQASAAMRTESWGAGVGFRELGSADYFEREARAVISLSPSPFLSCGVAVRALFVGGTSFAMERAPAMDVGLRTRLDPSTEVGLLLVSVAGGAPGDPDRRLSRSALGMSRALPGGTQVLLEIARRADREPAVAAAASWTPNPALTLCGGLREEPRQVSWGATIRLSGASLSFSSTESDPLGRTVRFGAAFTRSPATGPRIAQDERRSADS